MDRKEELRKKLRDKINQKRIQEGRQPQNVNSNDDILQTSINMIKDCQLPNIKRLNVRQKFNVLSKKYINLRDNYMPIFRSILNDELTMDNIGMLEMMLKMRNSASYDQMNNYLADKYKLDGDEASKRDDTEKVEEEFKDYVEKNKDKFEDPKN